MRITIELWSRVETGSVTPHWTAGARFAGTDIIFESYSTAAHAPSKALPLSVMLDIAREARGKVSGHTGFQAAYEMVEVGPDHVVFGTSALQF